MEGRAVHAEKPLRVLVVEDSSADACLARVALAGFRIGSASRLAEALALLAAEPFDVVLLDLGLPDSRGLRTFSVLHARIPTVPIVVLSGLDDERTAVDAVRLGAQDYLVKGKYGEGLLARAIRYAVERQRLVDQVARAVAHARKDDWLALCAWCKRLRDDQGRWRTIEEYLSQWTHAELTHGICPRCTMALPRDPGGREA